MMPRLALVAAFLTVTALASVAPRVIHHLTRRPPNIIIVLTDDQRYDSLEHMPVVSGRLATSAVRFRNAFVPTSQCCPSRASILTGRYLNDIDMGNLDPAVGPVLPAVGFHQSGGDAHTLAVWLKASGYRTALLGKYMTGNNKLAPTIPPGWDEWFTCTACKYSAALARYNDNGTIVAGQAYSTDELRQRAVAFIRENAERPFFLLFAPIAPHVGERGDVIPAPRHRGLLASVPPYTGGAYLEADMTDKPKWLQRTSPLSPGRQAFVQDYHRKRLESLLAVDEAVGAILDAIEAIGCEDNSVVIFTTDNGYLLGDHHYIQKLLAYEPSIRVPLLIHAPNRARSARTDDHLVLNIDLAATTLDLAGVRLPPMAGRSLVPFLDGSSVPWRQDFLLEYKTPVFPGPPDYIGVRTLTHKYVRSSDVWSGGSFEELYDLSRDPDELDNLLVVEPGVHDALAAALRARARTLEAE